MATEELKKLRKGRGQCKAIITRLENFLNDSKSLAEATIDTLEARRDKLITTLKEYEGIQLDILNIDEHDDEEVGAFEDKYYAVLGKLNHLIREMRSNVNNSCKLPSIEIDTYDGKDFTLFKPFMDIFNAVIDKNLSLSNVQKLFYLRKYLVGEALSVIINLPLVNDSYPQAISLLKKRFDNPTRIVSNHVNILLDLPQMQKGTACNIRSFISDVRQQLYALKNLEQPVDKWDMLLIPLLSRKLDQYTNRAYHLDRSSPDKVPTIEDFLEFLEKRAIALEDSGPLKNETVSKFKSNYSHKVSNVATKVNSKQTSMCLFCKSNHLLYICPKFKMAPLHDRLKLVSEHKLCSVCLRNHNDKCKFNFKCKVCKGSHNTLAF